MPINQIGLNDVATIFALLLSLYAVFLQRKRTKREVGKLEVDEIEMADYTPEPNEDDSVAGSTLSQVHFSGRNVRDGVLYISQVRAELEGIDETVELTHPDGPIQLEAREPFTNKYLDGELDLHVALPEAIDGMLLFDTSNPNSPVCHEVTFTLRAGPPT